MVAASAYRLCDQYMPRGSLRNVLDSPVSWCQTHPSIKSQILKDVAEAMTHLHEQNIYHRDLKRYAHDSVPYEHSHVRDNIVSVVLVHCALQCRRSHPTALWTCLHDTENVRSNLLVTCMHVHLHCSWFSHGLFASFQCTVFFTCTTVPM